MLLTTRQIEIFFEFYKNEGKLLTLSSVADTFKLSIRTIQNDLSVIRDACAEFGIEIESLPGKGCVLNILDPKLATNFVQNAQRSFESTNEFFNQSSRVDFLIEYLIGNNDYVKSLDLADMLYISQSRISSDLKILRSKLAKYNLTLDSKPSHGIKIIGSEIDKRFCLIKESIVAKPMISMIPDDSHSKKNDELQVISDILMNVFLDYKYRISEIVLQNLVIHVQVSISRIRAGYPLKLNEDKDLGPNFLHIEQMAREIVKNYSDHFNLDIYEDEIKYLAINIFGKRELDDENFISSKTSFEILEALEKIAVLYQIDLTNELDLRIALALHTMPLKTRVYNNMQFSNLSMLNLKQSFPLAHNIANDFALEIFGRDVVLTEDEIGYITIHFISPVDKKISNLDTNNILIISPYRQSDLFLIKQKILRNTNNIKDIDVITESEITSEILQKYSAVLTTDAKIAQTYPTVRYINFFLDDSDLKKIDYALRGLETIDYMLSKLHENLFFRGKVKDKKMIINKTLKSIHKHFGENLEFEQSVLSHENKTPSSYFGDGIAILHPEEAVSDTTFISVALLTEPILWDGENEVNIVLLVSIEKNNPQAFRLWNIISELISNKEFINSYQTINNYQDLYNLVSKIYSKLF